MRPARELERAAAGRAQSRESLLRYFARVGGAWQEQRRVACGLLLVLGRAILKRNENFDRQKK